MKKSHAERHPVAARMLRTTMAQVAPLRTDDRTDALHEITSELLGMESPRRHLAAELSGLGVHYHLGDGHPLLGRRMPDLDLDITSDRAGRGSGVMFRRRRVRAWVEDEIQMGTR
jgi:hypothetical protein